MIKIVKEDDYKGSGVYVMKNDIPDMEFEVNTRPGCYLNYDPVTERVICPWRKEEVALSVLLANWEREKKVENKEPWNPVFAGDATEDKLNYNTDNIPVPHDVEITRSEQQ